MNKKTDQPSASLGQTLGKADFTQRPMSLRKFLEPFDHRSLTDAEAGEKYALYKASFAKQQLEDVFEKHKNSAWFREKYHPDVRFNPEINMKLCKRRLEIFMDLYSRGAFNDVALHSGNEVSIVKLLDTVAVKLAGGNDEDVRFLDDFRYSDVKRKGSTNETSGMLESALMMGSGKTDVPETLAARNNTKTKKTAERSMCSDSEISIQQPESRQKKQKFHKNRDLTDETGNKQNDQGGVIGRSRCRSASGSSSDSQSSSSSNDEGSSSSSESGDRSADNNSSRSSSSSSSCGRSRSSSRSGSSSRSSGSEDIHNKNKVTNDTDPITPAVSVTDLSGCDQSHRPTGILVHRLGTLSTNDDSRIDHTSPENLRQNPCSLVKRHKLGDANAASTLNNRPHQPRVSDSDPMNSPVDTSFVHQRPVHHTSVLYFPHIPLNVYQKDLITLLSTSPHFIRLAVLDPCIMPASDNWRTNSETLFDPKGESSWLGIALRRVGWASFAAQIRNETNTLMEIDLDSIRAQLIEQASEAQAPDDLLNCLRLSRVIPYSMGLSPTDRIRSTGTVLSSLLNHCPSRVYSKGYLRRHLVLAARLTDELDKARSLWSSDDETCMGSAIPIDTENLAKSVGVHGGLISSEEVKFGGDHQGTQLTSVEGIIDPGEDLVSAATILNAVISRNPLLAGLTDCLVDEGSAEEELLLSGGFQAVSSLPDSAVPAILRTTVPSTDNTEMLQILDRLILYLRIVHSVDFYAPAFYVNEDAMPHPCQLMHVRPGKLQWQKASARLPHRTEQSLNTSHLEVVFVNQLRRIVRLIRPLSVVDCEKLGLRNTDDVVEAFVRANTRRKKRKTDVIWVCILSDKKFRDPMYVKKHILNKHMEKVEAVKKDTALYFNNYLMDPMRPQLPLEPRISSKKRRSRSPTDSILQKVAQKNEPISSYVNIFEGFQNSKRSTTDHSSQYWTTERRFVDSYTSNSSHLFPRDQGPPGGLGPPRPYIRMPYLQSRLSFNSQRGRYPGYGSNYQGVRQGFQRHPYVDLDAP